MAKKTLLQISNKVKFRKPSKSLSNAPTNVLTFKKTVPQLSKYVVQAANAGLLTKNQLEAGRIVLKRKVRPYLGNVWVLIKPDRIVTKRALETRMGRGKGSPNKQLALISSGQLVYELYGPPVEKMKLLYEKARQKFSIKTNLIETFTGNWDSNIKFRQKDKKYN